MELTALVVRNSFKSQMVAENDHLNHHELYLILNRMNASPFDEETYEQLWDQCKLNSKGEVRISDFIAYLLKGEELLVQKQQLNAAEIARLENAFKGKTADFSEQRKYKDDMEALIEQKQAIKNSLGILRKPFTAQVDTLSRQGFSANPEVAAGAVLSEHEEEDIVRQIFEYDSSETAGVLVIIFYITSTLIFLTWLTSFFTCSFLNLIAYCLILLQFAFQEISRKLVKLNLILLSTCTGFDILWFILFAGKLWYLPSNYEIPLMVSTYMQFSITLMILCVCLRTVLMYYYLSQFHLDQTQTYSIKLIGREVNIQKETEPLSASRNPLSYLLNAFFNKKVQGEQI